MKKTKTKPHKHIYVNRHDGKPIKCKICGHVWSL